ncbi:hypothetical protein CLAFUW4_01344 [Fulvia fulva]|uniref:Uncharacterized protein n=1 Tax=Passalora fulva TaxID=5499 RepID=A0A9Q8L8K4_PASFU|nr:uncharacterized protein CLAFUR5_01349 [Fulvia fulva]KAK4635856.1 hypothetical protein CLAFUR4_01345 [Fulvia fulva]KAK4638280.1 hypothetical protein CLAFUR0_01346 [Fulvia fulva]UJO12890.1 hypothetical protein CLAFUR5_01349 [Fulvia fulva]WPV10061.1 hypothetical protein CLAFUW4_01344 [Fulvia fulva]WPV23157.1 hypothetical protein CLAFUW7_01349 [Fulvia fulva]
MPTADSTEFSTSTSEQPQSHFLSIPPEVRLHIYEHVLENFSINDLPTPASSQEPALLNVCRLMRGESVYIFNARLTDILDERRAAQSAVRSYAEEVKAALDDGNILNIVTRLEIRDALNLFQSTSQYLDDTRDTVECFRSRLRKEGSRV